MKLSPPPGLSHYVTLAITVGPNDNWGQVWNTFCEIATDMGEAYPSVHVSSILLDEDEEAEEELYFDWNTMFKVIDAIMFSLPMNMAHARDIVNAMHDAGIVFRERRRDEAEASRPYSTGEPSRDPQAEGFGPFTKGAWSTSLVDEVNVMGRVSVTDNPAGVSVEYRPAYDPMIDGPTSKANCTIPNCKDHDDDEDEEEPEKRNFQKDMPYPDC